MTGNFEVSENIVQIIKIIAHLLSSNCLQTADIRI